MKKRVLALVLLLCFCLAPTAGAVEVTQVVPFQYDFVHYFSDGMAEVLRGEWPEGKQGFIDTTGQEVIPCQYESVDYFHDGLARVFQDGKWGYIDKAGKVVIPFQYDLANDFSEGLASVAMLGEGEDQWGNPLYNWSFIDQTGQEIIPPRYYDYAYFFHEGLAAVTRDEKWGFLDKTGREIVPCQFENFHVPAFSEGLVIIEKDYLYGFLNKAGRVVVSPKYDDAEPFSEGLAAVCKGGWGNEKWGFIDQSGREVIPCRYDEVVMNIDAEAGFSEGLAAVGLDGKFGFIDKTGKTVIPFQYDLVCDFAQGLAAACLDGKWGFIDKSGNTVIPFRYDNAGSFAYGVAPVAVDSGEKEEWGFPIYKWGLIDATGQEVLPCQYGMLCNEANQVYSVIEGMLAVERDGKWGYFAVTDNTAYASTQEVDVDGVPVEFACYALKDDEGNMTNYVKLRDLAAALNGTAAQFAVGWDGAVTITTQSAYTPDGTEGDTPYSGDRTYSQPTAATKVDGKAVELDAFVLHDDEGGGYTYYLLRDLGKALGFNVGWSNEKGVFVETDKPYDPAN